MKFLKYIFLSLLLLFGTLGYSQNNLLLPAPLIRWNLLFDGIDEYLNCGDIDLPNKFTLSIWIKFNSFSAQDMLIAKWNSGASKESYLFFYDNTGITYAEELNLVISSDGTTNNVHYRSSTTLSTGQWYNLTTCYDASESATNRVKFYVNGVEQTTVTALADASITPDNNDADTEISARSSDGIYTNCNADEPSFWNINLSQPEIAEIYNNNRPTNLRTHSQYSNCEAWYQMGEFSNYTNGVWNIVDASVNDNTAVSVNMDLTDRILTDLIYEQPIGAIKVGTSLIKVP